MLPRTDYRLRNRLIMAVVALIIGAANITLMPDAEAAEVKKCKDACARHSDCPTDCSTCFAFPTGPQCHNYN
jgi:hypothetical protein